MTALSTCYAIYCRRNYLLKASNFNKSYNTTSRINANRYSFNFERKIKSFKNKYVWFEKHNWRNPPTISSSPFRFMVKAKKTKIKSLLTSRVAVLSRQMSSYFEHRCANHRSNMLLTNKYLVIDLFPSLKRRINGARRQLNSNNKAPTLKLLFSTYLSWLTHKPPVGLQPAIQ